MFEMALEMYQHLQGGFVNAFTWTNMGFICMGVTLGIIFGVATPALVTYFSDLKTIVLPEFLILSFGISAGVGIVFGLYPAKRAADMRPIEALRHE